MNDTEGTKKAEESKRKARADRYFTMIYLCLILVYCLNAWFLNGKGVLVSYSLCISNRFGVPAGTSTTDNTEEETKKKARLARFGKETKVDSAEEDKRKARALRYFSTLPKFCLSLK